MLPLPRGKTPSTVWSLKLLMAASLVIPAFLFAVASWQNRTQVLHAAEERAQKTAATLHEHALKVLETHELVIAQIDQRISGADWRWIGAWEDLHRFLARLERTYPQIDGVWLVDGDGKPVNSSRVFPVPPLDLSDRDYWKAQRDRDSGLYIGEAYPGRLTGRMLFNISRRRSTPDASFDGVIAISVNPGYFSDFYATAATDRSAIVAFLRDDGAVLARYPATNPDPGLGTLAARHGVFTGTLERDGIERIYAVRPFDAFPLAIAYGIPQDAVLAKWYRNLRAYGLFAAPATLALFLLSWLALHRARQEDEALRRVTEETGRREFAEDALRQTQKMEALGQLTGGVAHDFNNLLTVVSGNLELAAARIEDDSRIIRFITAAQHAVRRGEELTRQLLAFSRQQKLRPQTVILQERLGSITDLIERSLRGDIAVASDIPDDLWPVEVDLGQLELALINLAVNARDAMPHGGVFRIEARNVTVAAGETEPPPGDYVRLAMRDTESGIAPDILARVFEPFFTTKDVGKGSGLGLSQVYGFARQSGGTISIESKLGDGTTLILMLPRANDVAEMPVTGGARDGDRGSGRILVIDDNIEIAEMAALLLRDIGYAVEVVNRPRRALELLQSEDFDLVFTDIVMPDGMSGLVMAQEIRRQWPDLPVLLATGYSAAVAEAAVEGFAIIDKPYRRDTLAAAVGRALAEPPAASLSGASLAGPPDPALSHP